MAHSKTTCLYSTFHPHQKRLPQEFSRRLFPLLTLGPFWFNLSFPTGAPSSNQFHSSDVSSLKSQELLCQYITLKLLWKGTTSREHIKGNKSPCYLPITLYSQSLHRGTSHNTNFFIPGQAQKLNTDIEKTVSLQRIKYSWIGTSNCIQRCPQMDLDVKSENKGRRSCMISQQTGLLKQDGFDYIKTLDLYLKRTRLETMLVDG